MSRTTTIPLTHQTKDHATWDLDEHISQYAKLGRSQFYTKLHIHPKDLERSNYPPDTLSIYQGGIVCKLCHTDAKKGWLFFESLVHTLMPQPVDTLNDAKDDE